MRPESRALTMREIEQEICSLRIDSVSLSADASGTLSIDEITLAPRNGGQYRLVLASAPDAAAALVLYEAHNGQVNDPEIPPATIDSWFERAGEAE